MTIFHVAVLAARSDRNWCRWAEPSIVRPLAFRFFRQSLGTGWSRPRPGIWAAKKFRVLWLSVGATSGWPVVAFWQSSVPLAFASIRSASFVRNERSSRMNTSAFAPYRKCR